MSNAPPNSNAEIVKLEREIQDLNQEIQALENAYQQDPERLELLKAYNEILRQKILDITGSNLGRSYNYKTRSWRNKTLNNLKLNLNRKYYGKYTLKQKKTLQDLAKEVYANKVRTYDYYKNLLSHNQYNKDMKKKVLKNFNIFLNTYAPKSWKSRFTRSQNQRIENAKAAKAMELSKQQDELWEKEANIRAKYEKNKANVEALYKEYQAAKQASEKKNIEKWQNTLSKQRPFVAQRNAKQRNLTAKKQARNQKRREEELKQVQAEPIAHTPARWVIPDVVPRRSFPTSYQQGTSNKWNNYNRPYIPPSFSGAYWQ